MATLISSRADALEIASANKFVLNCIDSLTFQLTPYFLEQIAEAREKGEKLSDAIHIERKEDFTVELAEADGEFDQQFKCLKAFVNANAMSTDLEKAKASNSINRVIENNNSNLHKFGYEKEVTAAEILLEDLNKEENKVLISKLVGVAEEVEKLAQTEETIHKLLMARTANRALKEKIIPSYIQRKEVRNLLNIALLPYINMKGKEESETFGEIAGQVEQFVTELNANIKLRLSRSGNSDSDDIENTDKDDGNIDDTPEE